MEGVAPESGSRYYRMCTNYRGENVCNWMVSAEESENLCLACRFNQSIPDLSVPGIAVYGNGWKAQSGGWRTRCGSGFMAAISPT